MYWVLPDAKCGIYCHCDDLFRAAQRTHIALAHSRKRSPPPLQVYVIGGLVDRTVRKGATLKMAQRCGAQAVRLPVAEHLGGLAKPVLNVNDVFAVLLAVHGGEGWREALERAIPARLRQQQTGGLQAKGAQPPAESAGEQQPTSSPQAAAATAPSEAATEAECDQC